MTDIFNNIDAVIFDIDGTLVDSLYIWAEIDIEFLGSFGLAVPDDYEGVIMGMSFVQVAEYTKERFNLPISVEEIMSAWNRMAEEKYANEIEYKPGAQAFLEECKGRNIKMGVGTSNSRHLVSRLFARLKTDDYISVVLTSDEVSNGKPAPDIYLEAAGRLGVRPERCLVFEDTIAGIEAGHNAGMKVCAVYDDATKDVDAQKQSTADYYINNYYELMELSIKAHEDIG